MKKIIFKILIPQNYPSNDDLSNIDIDLFSLQACSIIMDISGIKAFKQYNY